MASRVWIQVGLCTLSAGVLVGCEPDNKSDEGGTRADTGAIAIEDDPCADEAEAVAVRSVATGRTCPMPVDCVGLPEAYDRGWVAFSYTGSGLVLENVHDHEVCIEGWYLLVSEESQDSGFGDPGDDEPEDSSSDDGGGSDGSGDGGSSGDGSGDGGSSGDGSGSGDGSTGAGSSGDGASGDDSDGGSLEGEEDDPCEDDAVEGVEGGRIRLSPAQALSFGYAGGSAGGLAADNPTWWCVEETQVTVATDNWEFLGSRMPGPLVEYAVFPTDLDDDGVEDHADTNTGKYQTNHNIWDHMAAEPVFSIGRDRHYIDLAEGESARVTLTVRNMGRVAGDVTFTEVLPFGVEASAFSQEPSAIETDWRGRTVLTFDATVAGAIDTGTYEHTGYSQVDISYSLALTSDDSCVDRRHGGAPRARWFSGSRSHLSYGSPLIVGCCSVD